MSLIDSSYFAGDIFIPNMEGSNPVVLNNNANFNQIIARYEKDYLQNLLGKTLYEEFISAYATSQTWATNLKAELVDTANKISPIAYYCFYHWYRNQISRATNQGEIESKHENSVIVSPGLRLATAYNAAVDLTDGVITYLNAATDLPSTPITTPYVFEKINQFNF